MILYRRLLSAIIVCGAGATIVFGGSARAAEAMSFCQGNGRVTVLNFHSVFKHLSRELAPAMQKDGLIAALEGAGREAGNPDRESEVCRWNRFIFADFTLYFDLLPRLANHASDRQDPELRLRMLALRDRLYRQWMEKVPYQSRTYFAEWEGIDLRHESLAAYLARGSVQFGEIESVSALLQKKPKTPANPPVTEKDVAQSARLATYELLEARTPFSAIFPTTALSEARRPIVQSALSCLDRALRSFDCKNNVYREALSCAHEDAALATEALGLFSTQRMYLMRDLKSWMEQNLERADFDSTYRTFEDGSAIYFALETIGNRCGASAVYPPDSGEHQSVKSYHFWSEAYLTYRLRERGFAPAVAKQAALEPARRYKSLIQIAGTVYNVIMGNHLFAGTAGDKKQVLKEQAAGADFGNGLSLSDPAPSGP